MCMYVFAILVDSKQVYGVVVMSTPYLYIYTHRSASGALPPSIATYYIPCFSLSFFLSLPRDSVLPHFASYYRLTQTACAQASFAPRTSDSRHIETDQTFDNARRQSGTPSNFLSSSTFSPSHPSSLPLPFPFFPFPLLLPASNHHFTAAQSHPKPPKATKLIFVLPAHTYHARIDESTQF